MCYTFMIFQKKNLLLKGRREMETFSYFQFSTLEQTINSSNKKLPKTFIIVCECSFLWVCEWRKHNLILFKKWYFLLNAKKKVWAPIIGGRMMLFKWKSIIRCEPYLSHITLAIEPWVLISSRNIPPYTKQSQF